jgi:hypothetical protein
MECVSSSDDLPERKFDMGNLFHVTSTTSEVSCSELPTSIPHLVVEKTYFDEIEFSYVKKEISKGPAISGVLHICDRDKLIVCVGRTNKLESRQILRKDQLKETPLGKYYCIWNTTPVNINTSKRKTTVKYPLLLLFENKFVDAFQDVSHERWFPFFLPHATKLMGRHMERCFREILDNTVDGFESMQKLVNNICLMHITRDGERICSFRATVVHQPIESDPIHITRIQDNGVCTGQCEDYITNADLFLTNKCLMNW